MYILIYDWIICNMLCLCVACSVKFSLATLRNAQFLQATILVTLV
jgi:hypothetical protein